MYTDLKDVEKKILNLLASKAQPTSTEDLCAELKIPRDIASAALYSLLKDGLIKRVYTESYDPTRPFDTVSWTLEEKALGGLRETPFSLEREITLVMSKPFRISDLMTHMLNSYRAVELHEAYNYVIESAKHEIWIMSPVMDVYSLYPLMSKVSKTKDIRIRVLTEFSKSSDFVHATSVRELRNIEVKNAEKFFDQSSRRKAFGIHAKMVIADVSVALVGTFNLHWIHYVVNFDIGFLIHNKQVIERLRAIFDELWRYVSSSN